MDDTHSKSEPEFYRTVRRKNGRGYGPCDFEEFDRHSACSGHGRLGKVDVSCRFRFEESEWGLIGSKKPGCIIYMDMAFGVELEHILQSATILVTLESLDEARAEEQQALNRLARQRMFPLSGSHAQFTHFGPHKVDGRETEIEISDTTNIVPSLDVAGFGVGGMGWSRQKSRKYHSRWEFTGQLLGEDEHTSFRTLQWVLKENSLDSPSNHPNEFHTAFALVHGGDSFFIRVQLQGKLLGLKDHLKHKLHKLKFGVSGSKEKQSTLTFVSLDGVDLPKKQLLSKAVGLRDKLAERNGVVKMPEEHEMDPKKPTGRLQQIPITGNGLKDVAGGFPDGPSIGELTKAHTSLAGSTSNLRPVHTAWASSTTTVEKETTMEDFDSSTAHSEHEHIQPENQESEKNNLESHDSPKPQESPVGSEWRYLHWQLFGIPFFLLWARLFIPLLAKRLSILAKQIEHAERDEGRVENTSNMGTSAEEKGYVQ